MRRVDDAQGYKDLIPLFRAEKFNADEWAQLFKSSGAQYVVPVAEHHDGFSMYDSRLSDWTVVKMGPKRDTLMELATAVRAEGLHFGLSSHRAEHNFFFSYGRAIRSDVNDPKYASLYGPAPPVVRRTQAMRTVSTTTGPGSARPGPATGLPATPRLVEKYKPEIVYFDWWIGHPTFRQAVTEFAAFYYNFAAANGYTGVIDFKDYSLNWKSGTRDFERGQQDRHHRLTTGRPTPPSAMHRGATLSTIPSSRPSSSFTNSSTSSARTATCCSTSAPLRRHHPR